MSPGALFYWTLGRLGSAAIPGLFLVFVQLVSLSLLPNSGATRAIPNPPRLGGAVPVEEDGFLFDRLSHGSSFERLAGLILCSAAYKRG